MITSPKSTSIFVPELLTPAGDLERMKLAIDYGTDAIYFGGQRFGLRSRAVNFTDIEIEQGVELAKSRDVKTYMTLNSYLHDNEIEELKTYLPFLQKIGLDAVIVSDLGVLQTIRDYSDLKVHLSTQASCLNSYSAQFWKKQGVERIVLGREVSIEQAAAIKESANVEVEIFIHGSMCSAFSGHCTISNYTQGRDSNRGGCAHSCRFEYSLDYNLNPEKIFIQKEKDFEQEAGPHQKPHTFMSSKDLMGIETLKLCQKNKIDSLKIEGRMKGHLYLATITKIYREALDELKLTGNINQSALTYWKKELERIGHRGTTTGNLIKKAQADSIESKPVSSDQNHEHEVAAIVIEKLPSGKILAEVRNNFTEKSQLELISFAGKPIKVNFQNIVDLNDCPLTKTSPNTLIKISSLDHARPSNIIRKRIGH